MQTPYWADYLVAFRRREGLTQAELAAKLGVKAPTVSRWESGVHVPDMASQKALKALLGAFDTNTEAEWVFRVGAASGVEFLISRDGGLIASSRGGGSSSELKMYCTKVFADRSVELDSAKADQQQAALHAGLFDGSIRFLHFAVDTTVIDTPASFVVDVWPIVTTEQSALVHICAHAQSAPSGARPGPVKARNLTFVSR